MKKKSVILLGGGGHAKSCIEVILSTGMYDIAGILDIKEKIGQNLLGFSIIGTDDDLDSVKKKCDCFAITVGHISSASNRIKMFNRLKSIEADLPFFVASTAHISSFASIGSATMIFHNAVVNASVRIGDNCIINSCALVEHDVIVANHCHISTSAVLNGNVYVNEGAFIGSNATILQGRRIGQHSIIGAGSVVLKDVEDKTIVAGTPAKRIGYNE